MRDRRVVIVEQTAKRWKLCHGVGVAMVIVSATVWMVSLSSREGPSGTWALVLLAGLILYFIGRFGAWWFHG